MRLLITTDTVGGVWTYTKELSEGLLLRGHHVLLISMGRLPSSDQHDWTRRMESQWSDRFSYLPTDYPLEWMRNNDSCYCAAERLLLSQIAAWAPDALHLNQFCYGALPTDLPKTVIAHSDVVSWHQACRGGLPTDSSWFRHYHDTVSRGLAQAHAVVAPTWWMLDALCSNFAVAAYRTVIPNGRALPASRASSKRAMQAVTIGRLWDEGKNVRLLEKVSSPMPLLVGGELALETEPPFTSSRLMLLGPLSEQQTLALFAHSSLYIATSRYEPFGLAPLEAALCGCAIVASDLPSLREVWGNSALYFKSADDLSRLLHALHRDPALVRQSARQAYARARSKFSRDAMIESYINLYDRLRRPIRALSLQEGAVQHVV